MPMPVYRLGYCKHAAIQIIDVYGKMVIQKRTAANQHVFEVMQIPAGTYFIRAINGKSSEILSKLFKK